jgi:hypothetical protein
MNKDGRAAFPTPPIILDDASVGVIPDSDYHGMTMRQAYKLAGLTGWLAGIAGQKFMDDYDDDSVAFAEHQMAVAKAMGCYADAMLAEDAAHEKEGEDER